MTRTRGPEERASSGGPEPITSPLTQQGDRRSVATGTSNGHSSRRPPTPSRLQQRGHRRGVHQVHHQLIGPDAGRVDLPEPIAPFVTTLAALLDARQEDLVPALFQGVLFAHGRRTATAATSRQVAFEARAERFKVVARKTE